MSEEFLHLPGCKSDVGRYVLLPGDPGRTDRIASHFDDARLVGQRYEFRLWNGLLEGERVSVCSTGMGCPSTAVAVEELCQSGADTFIRVGTSGSMQPGQRAGELAIVTGAIRDERTSRQYLPLEFPAVAHHRVVRALEGAASRQGLRAHLGVTHSKDAFYAEVEPERLPLAATLQANWRAWVAGGAVCSEMESATLFILASIYRRRAGGVMLLAGGQDEVSTCDTGGAIRVAVDALRLLITEDKKGR